MSEVLQEALGVVDCWVELVARVLPLAVQILTAQRAAVTTGGEERRMRDRARQLESFRIRTHVGEIYHDTSVLNKLTTGRLRGDCVESLLRGGMTVKRCTLCNILEKRQRSSNYVSE